MSEKRELTYAEWQAKHTDYRLMVNGQPHVVTNGGERGTILEPVQLVRQEEYMREHHALYRGRHRLPHQSQLIRRDLHAERLAEHLGEELNAQYFTEEQAGQRAEEFGFMPYRITVTDDSFTAFTAFYTPDALAAWAEAYGLTYTLPEPGNTFKIGVPQTTGSFMPLTEENKEDSPAQRVMWRLIVHDGQRRRSFWQTHKSGADAWNAAQKIVNREFMEDGSVLMTRPAFDAETYLIDRGINPPDGVSLTFDAAIAHGYTPQEAVQSTL